MILSFLYKLLIFFQFVTRPYALLTVVLLCRSVLFLCNQIISLNVSGFQVLVRTVHPIRRYSGIHSFKKILLWLNFFTLTFLFVCFEAESHSVAQPRPVAHYCSLHPAALTSWAQAILPPQSSE